MENLRKLIVAYYETEPNTVYSAGASLDIDRNVRNLIRQGVNEDNIIDFLNRTQDEILAGLPVDDPKRMQRRYVYRKRNFNMNRQEPTPVRPLVAGNEQMMLVQEARLALDMIPGLARTNIAQARQIVAHINQIFNSETLKGFDRERNEIQQIIEEANIIIQNEDPEAVAAREAARVAVREAAWEAAREAREARAAPRAAPRAPVVSPDSLPIDIKAERLDSKTLEQYQEMMECPICYQNIRNIRIVPCGHTICKSCAENIISHQEGNKRCPICNAPREGFNKAFYAKYLKYKTKYLELKNKIK